MKQLLAITAILFLLAACDEPFPSAELEFETVGPVETIRISNVELFSASGGISELAFLARVHQPAGSVAPDDSTLDADGNDTRVMLRISFDAAVTTITLPQNPPAELLRDIASDFPGDFTISDPEARTLHFTEIACDVSEEGRFSKFLHLYLDLRPDKSENYAVGYVYCDRPATVTGEGLDWWNQPTVYNLSLQQGWNMVVERVEWAGDEQNKSVSNLMPEGMRWKQNMWIGDRGR